MAKKEKILPFLSKELAEIFNQTKDDLFESITEIRLRVKKPLIVKMNAGINEKYFISQNGLVLKKMDKAYIVSEQSIAQSLGKMSSYSLYAFEEEMKNGFITLQGGHRVGICGKAVIEGKEIKTIKNIASMNIRISHEIFGCGDKLMDVVMEKGRPVNTLIVSPPGCGKTTLLRDMIRSFSNNDFNVSVVDERSEIGGCHMGIPQNDLGYNTDILDGCPKTEGMILLLRSMSPDIIAVDEIGKKSEIDSISDVLNAGVKLLCTVHGYDEKDIQERAALKILLQQKIFERIIVISGKKGAGTIEKVLNKDMEVIDWKN